MQMNNSENLGLPRRQMHGLRLRAPISSDGSEIYRLIEDAGVLDTNSLYCNLLQCSHFASTCALAELDGKVVGWVSGYIPPEQTDTLFVWQVCVDIAARGRGVAQRLITSVLERSSCAKVRRVECTITKSNNASWSLFQSVADALDTELTSQQHFLRDLHLDGQSESEIRVTIGPYPLSSVRLLKAA
jgi:L-2,4-diaminobutyric acid acetyltransferase